jgi:hypothetical protein
MPGFDEFTNFGLLVAVFCHTASVLVDRGEATMTNMRPIEPHPLDGPSALLGSRLANRQSRLAAQGVRQGVAVFFLRCPLVAGRCAETLENTTRRVIMLFRADLFYPGMMLRPW